MTDDDRLVTREEFKNAVHHFSMTTDDTRLVTREEFEDNARHFGVVVGAFELSDMVDNKLTIPNVFLGKNVVGATIHFRTKTDGNVGIVSDTHIAAHFADVMFTIDDILRGSVVPGHSFLCEKAWYPFSVAGFANPTLHLIFENAEEVRQVKDMMVVELVVNTVVFKNEFVSTVLQKQFDVEWFNGERIRFVGGFYGIPQERSKSCRIPH